MIELEELGKKNGKKVLLYSGGMDSYIIAKLEKPDVLLYVNTRSNYAKLEIEFLNKQGIDVVVDDRLDLGDVEMASALVPLRNLFLAMIGTYYGDEIILGATSGDRSYDKDVTFARKSTELLQYIYQPSWWSEGREININLKYKEWTKKQLVDEYLKQGYSIDDLVENSMSCYTPVEGKQCGKCKPCVRKWLFMLPYKDTAYMYDSNPRDFYTEVCIAEIEARQGTNLSRGGEDTETLDIYNKYIRGNNEI